MPFLLFAAIIIAAIVFHNVYGNKARIRWQSRNYDKIKPVKLGDYYSIISFWSTDHTSREMVIHNINPQAEEAKMVILKSDAGYIMRVYGRDESLMTENTNITTYELADKFMEMRQPPASSEAPSEQNEQAESRTVEFK